MQPNDDKNLTTFEHKMANFANLAYYIENTDDNKSYIEHLQEKLLEYKQKTSDTCIYCVIMADDNTAIIENSEHKELYLLEAGTRISLEQYSKMHMIDDCCNDIDLYVWQNAQPRMHKLTKLIEQILNKRDEYIIYATGHSLGGYIVNRLAEKYEWLMCYSFNAPGVAHCADKIIVLDNLHTYSVDADIISNKIGTKHYQGKVNKVVHYVHSNISPHSILNFTDEVAAK